jgi:hypothetical protein
MEIASGVFFPTGMTLSPHSAFYASNVGFGLPPVGLGDSENNSAVSVGLLITGCGNGENATCYNGCDETRHLTIIWGCVPSAPTPSFVAQKNRAEGAFLRSTRQLCSNGSPVLTCGQRIDTPEGN